MEVTIGKGAELTKLSQAIRYQVFTVEQNIPSELDLDGLDKESFHLVVTNKGEAIATARLTVKEDGMSILARVAVTEEYRGLGVASKVVQAFMVYAQKIEVGSIEIHAHCYLRKFYEKFGFMFIKEVEVVGEHQLIAMHYKIARV
ncbi:GNAT family N-acetyltransferase [Photobacterium nomapromontoriensis]|uniref:GNAT family N-acetyltransferase n=1 Tax=Photobacterium nomapromontoriensis TaxID=2910237 RepID=UPI003D13113A